MAVTYEQAREIVRAATEPDWSHGTFCLDDRNIAENDELYVFDIGAREYIVDGNESYALFGAVPVVYKEDGRLEWPPSVVIGTDPTIQIRPNPSPTFRL